VCVCVGSKREVKGDVLVMVIYCMCVQIATHIVSHPPTTTYQPYALDPLACLFLTNVVCVCG